MTVVSDTTTLNYLIQIGLVEVLSQTFGHVNVPTAVIAELKGCRGPKLGLVREWASAPPAWLVIKEPAD
jgi:predicted nucleic acid-binding protein